MKTIAPKLFFIHVYKVLECFPNIVGNVVRTVPLSSQMDKHVHSFQQNKSYDEVLNI